jgi:hypothetical protein
MISVDKVLVNEVPALHLKEVVQDYSEICFDSLSVAELCSFFNPGVPQSATAMDAPALGSRIMLLDIGMGKWCSCCLIKV